MGVQSDIGVQNILFGADKGRSHKTSRSYSRGSLVAGTTVHKAREIELLQSKVVLETGRISQEEEEEVP